MKLLIITPHFYPENFKVNDMAFELKRRGHDVSVMTPIPDYPQGKFYKGYGIFRRRKEIINGVKVHRSLIVPRHNGTSFWLALNYISYTFFASLKSLWYGVTKKYDAVIVHEPSPILVGLPAIIIKKIQGIPIHFWVLDLWPESLTAAGGIDSKLILSPFEKMTRWVYKNCKTILIGSKGYKKSICSKGDFKDKIHYFPNWVEDCLVKKGTIETPELPEGFNVMIAGNMGDAQDLPHVMNAAKQLKGMGVNFIFVGDGRKKEYVLNFAKENGIENQIYCIGRFPLEAMPTLFSKADLLFMALKDTPIFAMTVPSRLQAYMSSGKPVVAMINGEGADLIEEADCGWSVAAGNSKGLADLLLRLSKGNPETLIQKGQNGKVYSETHFKFKDCMDHLESIICK